MRGIEFVNDLCCNYLTVPYEGDEENFALRMMTENTTAAFLPVELRRLNEQIYLYYNISGMQNMEILYGETPIDRKTFQTFMWQLHEAIEECRELFLAGDGICLEPALLFWDLGMRRWKFLYVPGQDTRESEESKNERENMAEFLVMHMDYEDKALADTVYRFYEEVCAGINFPWGDPDSNLYGLKETPQETVEWEEEKEQDIRESEKQGMMEAEAEKAELLSLEAEEESDTANNRKSEKGRTALCGLLCAAAVMTFVSVRILPGFMRYTLAADALLAAVLLLILIKRKSGGREEEYRAETVTDAEPEDIFYKKVIGERKFEEMQDEAQDRTVYIQMPDHQEKKLYGVGKCRRQKIFLERMPCLVGKDKTLADHVIADSTVSRMHAKFSLEGEAVWMQDLNSTNGTYHNGMRLAPNEKVALEPEDEIAFGQAQFVFR